MNPSIKISTTKLRKLLVQLQIAKLADYSYPDGLAALDLLASRVRKEIESVNDSAGFSDATRLAILREANYTIINITKVIGIVTRSLSVRNAFELYVPFLDICKNLVGENAKLLLSSEWQYVPFTYPQNISDLPEFIVIGLPAPESDNMLVFPAAGHELGHSVWSRKSLREYFKPEARSRIDIEFEQNKNDLFVAFPALRGEDLSQNLFAQQLKSVSLNSSLDQAEEIFCDFIGLILFGESYLRSFEYLVAPMLSGVRSFSYPETKQRARTLNEFALQLGASISNYEQFFSQQAAPVDAGESFLLKMADLTIAALHSDLFKRAQELLHSASILLPSVSVSSYVEQSFRRGIPFDKDAALGDLMNAAWRVYLSGEADLYERQGREPVDYLADLVVKSAEIYEINKHVA